MVRGLLLLLGVFHVANGLWMVSTPAAWYDAIPGVAATGPRNLHFIADIGLAFVASGAGLLLGVRRGMAALALAGATWPALHAGLHVWNWVHHGLPADVHVALSEILGVAGSSALGLVLALVRVREEGGL